MSDAHGRSEADRRGRVALLATLLVATLLIAFLHDDYGVGWDAESQVKYGELVVESFASGFEDRRADSFRNLRYYAPHFELVPAIVARGRAQDPDFRHLWTALVTFLPTIAAVVGVARLLARRRASEGPLVEPEDRPRASLPRGTLIATLGVLALTTMPRFVGHGFTNIKDGPFAATVAVAILAFALLAVRGPSPLRLLGAGVALGMALGARPGGFPLLAAWLALALFLWIASAIADPSRPPLPALGRSAVSVLVVVAIGWTIMILPWPWAHLDPIGNPWRAIAEASSFPHPIPVLHGGVEIPSTELPLHYLFEMLLITIPVPHLLLAGVGAVLLTVDVLRAPLGRRGRAAIMALSWPAAPLAGYLVLHPPIYDGMRHFLFIVPGLALLAGVGAARLVMIASGARRRAVLFAVAVLALAWGWVPTARLHPYETTYFNALVGGVGGVDGVHDTDYWILSYREAIDWIGEREDPADGPVNVLIGGDEKARYSAEAAAPDHVVIWTLTQWEEAQEAGATPELDYLVATTRFNLARDLYPTAPVVHWIGRRGAVFTVIKGPPPTTD